MTRRIAFVLPDMSGGGAERLTLDLMRGFLDRGAEVDLVLQRAEGSFLPVVPEGVRIIDLKTHRLRHVARHLRRYYRAERPDAVLAAMWPLTTIATMAAAGLSPKPFIVVAEHCALLEQYRRSPITVASLRATLWAGHRFADAVVAVADGLSAEVAALAGLPRDKVMTIWNPIPPPICSDNPPDWGQFPGPRLLAVGSFKDQKNFPLLIRAFARFAAKRDAVLAIVGEGAERPRLESLISQLGLTGRVLLPGFTTTPGDWYRTADMFAMSSNYEGCPLVLVEALHHGLPVVSTACKFGPDEVLENGRWGTLVPVDNEAALASALEMAIDGPNDPDSRRARAAYFSVERSVESYWQLMVRQ